MTRSQRRPADPKVVDELVDRRLVASGASLVQEVRRALAGRDSMQPEQKRVLADHWEAAVDASRASSVGGGDRG